MVPVNYASGTAPSDDLSNADLIVLSEAVEGYSTLTNGMKGFVGSTPMINLKFWAYTKADTKNRWGWGTPSNPSTADLTITPDTKLFKVLDGVTYEDNGSIKLYTQVSTTSKANAMQGVTWNASPTAFVSSNVDMATTDSKVSMHGGTKFFGLALSCDSRSYYNDNAKTIIKNAAAMLIAGESVTAKNSPAEPGGTTDNGSTVTVPVSANMAGWRSFYDASQGYTVAAETKVYYASATNAGTSKVTLTEIDGCIPAGTPVVLYEAGATEITLTKTDADLSGYVPGTNKLAVTSGASTDLSAGVYRLGYKTSDGVGFYKYTNAAAPAGIIYISALDAGANFLGIDLGDGETTGIESVDKPQTTTNREVYNLAGQRVAQPTKGLYIVNGKKVLVK